jgi:hypothetical protein
MTLKELYAEQKELREKLKKIETEISRKTTEECKEKLDTAFSILEDVYNIISFRDYPIVSIDCDNCDAIIRVGLDDAMDKMRYAFEQAMKGV